MIDNFRTPGLDLDCLYGPGPGPHRSFTRAGRGRSSSSARRQRPADDAKSPNPVLPTTGAHPEGFALIGDHRNDENLFVAQTHLAFLKFHNKVVDQLVAHGTPAAQLFAEARRSSLALSMDGAARLRRAYHRAGHRRTSSCTKAASSIASRHVPFMPVEFSGAAYRLGHSMVRESIATTGFFRPVPPRLTPATLALLFQFSGLSGDIDGERRTGLPRLPSNWVIDWRRFYDFNTPASTPSFGSTIRANSIR